MGDPIKPPTYLENNVHVIICLDIVKTNNTCMTHEDAMIT